MPVRIELPKDLIDELEQEAALWHLPLAEILREALQVCKASREPTVQERDRVIRTLRDRGCSANSPQPLRRGRRGLSLRISAS
jgi:hypothetical protein